MPTYTATDYEPVAPGLYTARLEKIEEATSQHGTYYRWCFVIEDEGERDLARRRALHRQARAQSPAGNASQHGHVLARRS
jgi:hypothetical protein